MYYRSIILDSYLFVELTINIKIEFAANLKTGRFMISFHVDMKRKGSRPMPMFFFQKWLGLSTFRDFPKNKYPFHAILSQTLNFHTFSMFRGSPKVFKIRSKDIFLMGPTFKGFFCHKIHFAAHPLCRNMWIPPGGIHF